MIKAIKNLIKNAVFNHGAKQTRLILNYALRDKNTCEWIIQTLSNKSAIEDASFSKDMPKQLNTIDGFEHCYWLYSSNAFNHRLSRLRFDEGAFLYKYIKMLKNPYIIELGRYKGGTTFLMAAAGGRVVSLDNGAIADQEYFTNELKRALSKFNFLHRAEIVIADALKYEIKPETYDLVFLDCAYNFAYAKKFFDLWWNAVKTGGIFIFRDGKDTVLKDVARFVETIDGKIFGAEIDNDLPGSFVLCRKLDKFYFSS